MFISSNGAILLLQQDAEGSGVRAHKTKTHCSGNLLLVHPVDQPSYYSVGRVKLNVGERTRVIVRHLRIFISAGYVLWPVTTSPVIRFNIRFVSYTAASPQPRVELTMATANLTNLTQTFIARSASAAAEPRTDVGYIILLEFSFCASLHTKFCQLPRTHLRS